MERAAEECGLLPWEAEELTCGELRARLSAVREQERRRVQSEAVVAYHQAGLLAGMLTQTRPPELYEAFPFWNEEEIREMRVEKYRRIMERHAAAGRGGEDDGKSNRTAGGG